MSRHCGCKTRAMGFFSDLKPPSDAFREPEPRRVRWRGDPDDTAGVPVHFNPLVVHNDQVAIVASSFFAYPTGFSFSLVTISRLSPAPSSFGTLYPGFRGQRDSLGGEFRFGIGFADGSKVINGAHPIPGEEPPLRLLRPQGGGGGGRKWSQQFWCEPLPPAGSMVFVFEWRDFEVMETSIEVDATSVLDAGTHAAPLWPEDVDLLEEPGSPSGRAGTRWNSSSFGKMQS